MAGGNGGRSGSVNNGGGAGGTGDTAQAGQDGSQSGGGGGGASGPGPFAGPGGNGGGTGSGAGGAGGTATDLNGSAGSNGSITGGGGGGGAGLDGYSGSGTVQLPGATQTFNGGNGGAGGAGGTYGGGGGGGAGGYGAVATNAQISSAATLTGGIGGAGGAGTYAGSGGDGGVGLAAITNGVAVNNSGNISGGAGGQSVSAPGRGGAGLSLGGAGSITNTGKISGGTGGTRVASNSSSLVSGAGGSGGDGVAANGEAVQNEGEISGGNGGNATGGIDIGGAGGSGIDYASTVTNSGTITGGSDGQASYGFNQSTAGGAGVIATASVTNEAGGVISGGNGFVLNGSGVEFSQIGGKLVNAGRIQAGHLTSVTGRPASGAVIGEALTVVDTGTIAGASNPARGGSAGDAVTFTGGANTIAFGASAGLAGSTGLTGALDIKSGSLTFNQNAGSGLPSNIEVSAPIIGAGAIIQNTAGGTLTLSGTNTFSGGLTIRAGTQAVAADSNLGASSSGLTFYDQGTLETTASFSTARGVVLAENGTVQVDSGATTTLTGLVSGSAPQFFKTGAGKLVLASANNSYQADTTIQAGTLSISADADLGNTSGRIDLEGGTLETTATLTSARTIQVGSNSTVQVDGGTTTLTGSIDGEGPAELTKTGVGTLALSGGAFAGTIVQAGTLDLARASAGGNTITFAGSQSSPATLALETAAQPGSGQTFQHTLASFAFGDALDLKGLAYTDPGSSMQESYTVTRTSGSGATATTSGRLAVAENGKTEFFNLSGIKAGQTFFAESDGHGGTLIYAPICFAQGTPIRAVRDGVVCEVSVEDLSAGDLVVTASGEHRPVRWMGHRTVNCLTHPDPRAAIPVRIAAGAFGPERPSRDIYLSPQHGVAVDCVGEVLIPIKHLINGGTIARAPRPRITYWHVELDSHDIVLAGGLPCESFLDTQGRVGFFDNGADHLAAHPDTVLATMDQFCRPLVQDGPLVPAIRSQLLRRMEQLGWTATDDADLHMVADGVRLAPATAGSAVRFTVPAGSRDVRIVSRSFVPQEVDGASGDGRTLGVALKRLVINDGFGDARIVAVDDSRLATGFNDVQSHGDARWRWTDGNAVVPVELWAGCDADVFLTLDLAPEWGCFKGWQRPAAIDEEIAVEAGNVVAIRAAG